MRRHVLRSWLMPWAGLAWPTGCVSLLIDEETFIHSTTVRRAVVLPQRQLRGHGISQRRLYVA